ncbi:MAG: hypothetical protein KDK37_10970 [Leptospiraceae bacterium]|nr:hypothetical protein [Leptospiraceae bacterium]MCB1304794.1 hypothetical protein [Leptospiraceae bacterium]
MKHFVLCFLALSIASSLHAEDRRWSFFLGGGFSQYQYESPGDPGSIFAFSSLNSSSSPEIKQFQQAVILESVTSSTIETKETHGRLGFEYLFGDGMYFGLNFGLSYASGKDRCVSNCGELTQLALLNALNAGGTSASTLTTQLILFPGLFSISDSSDGYSTTMLDIGFNGHFNPRGTFDPYVGLDIGGGICQFPGVEGITCTVAKVAPKLGFRYNFSEAFFAYLQTEYQIETFQISGGSTSASDTYENPVALIGLGVRW